MSENNEKFSIDVNNATKKTEIVVRGFFNENDGKTFISEYERKIKQISPSEYELTLDCTDLKVTAQDLVPMFTGCFEMYKKDGFKKVIFNCGSNIATKMQINRISRQVGLPNYEVL